MMKHYHFFSIALLFSTLVLSQEIKQFTVGDFDLRGNVKICQVITDYGQEIFEFDVSGKLVMATTQYNEEDKDITNYKYVGGELVEKRVESYKDNVLDMASSMAYFYDIDTTDNRKVKEHILSYDKEFVEVQEYLFDENDQLFKIMVSHEDAVDEIEIENTSYKNETTKTFFENGVVQKSIRRSKQGELLATLTKTYLDGEPNEAVEEVTDKKGLLVSKEVFQYDLGQKEFVSIAKHFYGYDAEDILLKETIKQGHTISEKEYIFQFDDNEEKNWVKKIITPDNLFETRRITYYPMVISDIEMPK